MILFASAAAHADLTNTATATGTPAKGALTAPSDTVALPVAAPAPGMELLKTVTANDENGDGHGQVGETLTYTFSVENTGNTTLTNISLTDPSVTIIGGPILSLAPGATDAATFSAVYTLTPADIAAGSHQNQAQATATPSTGGTVTDDSDSTNPADETGGGSDPTTILLTDAPIVATDNSGTSDSTGGVVAGLNVLTNDTLNGVAIVPADVTIAPVTTGPLTVNADGTVTVAPGTPSGPYTVSYTVCEVLNPANCDTADVIINVNAGQYHSGRRRGLRRQRPDRRGGCAGCAAGRYAERQAGARLARCCPCRW